MNIVTDTSENSVLRQPAQAVSDPTQKRLTRLVDEMIEAMRAKEGVGLAAPQVGVSERIAVFEVLPEHRDNPLVCVNPTIVKAGRELIMGEEGCLSLPGLFLPVVRARHVRVCYFDLQGRKRHLDAEDFFAVALQHEIDHLDGILMTDRYNAQARLRAQFVPSTEEHQQRL